MGQLLHRFESPNRFGLPDFYTLQVLAWKENPTGMFVNWHSYVKCSDTASDRVTVTNYTGQIPSCFRSAIS